MHDQYTLQRIIDAINPNAEDTVVEIGPGRGALTFPLLQRCGELNAIEIDNDLAKWLTEQAPQYGQLRLHHHDALKFDFSTLVKTPGMLRVTGNLPYNISTPLLFHLIKSISSIKDMHFLLQKEVVDRMAAQPGNKTYGRLSVMVQYHCQAERLFDVGPGAFTPPPKVDSAVIRLLPREAPVTATGRQYFAHIVQQGFSQRRKTLRKSLKNIAIEEDFTAAGIDSGLRPEQLGFREFVELSNRIIERDKHQRYHLS